MSSKQTPESRRRRLLRSLSLVAVSLASTQCAGRSDVRSPREDAALRDQVAIRALIDSATDAINHHEWDKVESMLAADAVWEALPPVGWKLQSRKAIRNFFDGNEGKVEVLLYTLIATSVELESPESAKARSTMSEVLHLKEKGEGIHIVGTYSDRFVKRDGRWLFSHRRFALRYEDDVPLPARMGGTKSKAVPAKSE
jgi:ketosteroid isomerase-like protein